MAFPTSLQNIFAFRTYSNPALPNTVPFNTYTAFQYDWFWLSYTGNTLDLLIQYYADLLILQYRQEPRAYAMISSIVSPVIMGQLPLLVQDAFNLNGSETAIGVQLDLIGKYAGVSRNGNGFFGPVTLNDTDYLNLIRLAIIRNSAGSSLATIQSLLSQYFAGDIYLFDYTNMQISYLVSDSLGSQNLIQLFVTSGLLPRPMGVSMSVVAAPIINKFFGLRTYQGAASPLTTPLQTYSSYNTSWLWLTYQDAVAIII